MTPEFTLDQIRAFVKQDYQSVAARMTKSLLLHYDELYKEKGLPVKLCTQCHKNPAAEGRDLCEQCIRDSFSHGFFGMEE